VSIGVREGKVYMLEGNFVRGSKGILDHGSMLVIEDKEKEASKETKCSKTSNLGFNLHMGRGSYPLPFLSRG
jgi:hypothetical protein